MNPIAKILIAAGIVLVTIGLFVQFGAKYLPLGKLPGDLMIARGNLRFYFPLVTCLLISLVLTLIGYFFRR